jgi:PKD repeat protein
VTVVHIDPENPTSSLVTADDRGMKRVEVSVEYEGAVLATRIGFHTDAWQDMIPTLGGNTTGAAPPVNNGPTAVAAGGPLLGGDPLTVDFDATGSTDADGDPLTYSWDFGDGTRGSGSVVGHTYSNAGTYLVTLTVVDGDGAQDTDTLSVTVN